MSLPSPSPYTKTPGNIPPRQLSPEEQEAWDAPYMALAQRSGGDLRLLMQSFFSFLHRKTDFYIAQNPMDVQEGISVKMGFKEGNAEKLLLASFRQYPLRRMPRMSEIQSREKQQQQQQQSKVKKASVNKKVESAKVKSDKIDEKKQNVEKVSDSKIPNDDTCKKTTTVNKTVPDNGDGDNDGDQILYSEEGKQIPVGNGGTSLDYNFKWTQSIQELSIALPLPLQTRAKDLDVIMKHDSILVKRKEEASVEPSISSDKTSPVLVEGKLKHTIRTDESTWTIEDNVLLIVLDKMERIWWDAVLMPTTPENEKNRNIIDTSLVDSTSRISEYDQATQGMIRKIMFDQRQERLGQPKSDDILRQEALERLRNGEEINYDPPLPPKSGNPMISKGNIPKLPPGVEYIDKHNFPK